MYSNHLHVKKKNTVETLPKPDRGITGGGDSCGDESATRFTRSHISWTGN